MSLAPVYIVDIIGEVVAAADAVLYPTLGKHLNYLYGRDIQTLQTLQELTNSVASKDKKYPLVYLAMDFPEDRGNGYYADVTFPQLFIATSTGSTDKPDKRYAQTFKPVLYPIYYEILRQLAKHKSIVQQDPDSIIHRKYDRPGTQPAGKNFNDYLDGIDIERMQLTFNQFCS